MVSRDEESGVYGRSPAWLRTIFARVLACAWVGALGGGLVAQEEEPPALLRADRNLAGLVQRDLAMTPPASSGLLDAEEGQQWALDALRLGSPRTRRLLDADVLVDVLQFWLLHRFGEDSEEFLYIELDGLNLRILAPEEMVRAADEFLRAFGAAVAPRLQVEAWLVELPPEHATDPEAAARRPVQVSISELDRLLERGRLRWHGRATTRSGQAVRLGGLREQRFLRSYAGEVAQGVGAGYPLYAVARDGVDLVVEPHVMAGGSGLLCYLQGLVATMAPELRERPLGLDGQTALQVPDIASSSFATGYHQYQDRVACLWSVGAASDGPSFLLAVRVERLEPAVGLADVDVLPVSSLGEARLSEALAAGWRLDDQSNLMPDLFRALAATDGTESAPAGRDADAIENFVQNDLEGDDYERVSVFQCGPALVLIGAEDVRQRLARSVMQLEALGHQSVVLEFMTRTDAAGSGAVIHHLMMPGLAGRAHSISRGRETTWITGYDLSIAQDYVFYEPRVQDVFHGVIAALRPWRTAQGIGVDARVELLELGPAERRAGAEQLGGDVWQGTVQRCVFHHDGAAGEVIEFGSGPRRASATGEVVLLPALQVSGRRR